MDSNDGFAIAEMDLKLRGPGEFFGIAILALRIASVIRDREILGSRDGGDGLRQHAAVGG